jgi:uncharacterized protein YggE
MPSGKKRSQKTRTATVSVVGSAVLRSDPDEATVVVHLSALRDAPGPALDDVSDRSRRLTAILDDLGIGSAERATTGVSVGEDFDHTPAGRRSLGHRATASVAVRVSDLELIGRLLTRATTEVDARVDGPHWQVRADNPIHLEAARQAAADAERRARAYAEGVGAELGPLIALTEHDPMMPLTRRPKFLPARTAAAAGEIPIESAEQEIAASVEVTFALSAPARVSRSA